MHVHDVVETGSEWGVVQAPEDRTDAAAWLATSITASVAANELARAMGMRDLYPFALTAGVRAKVEFCWRLLPGPRRLSARQLALDGESSTQNDRLGSPRVPSASTACRRCRTRAALGEDARRTCCGTSARCTAPAAPAALTMT